MGSLAEWNENELVERLQSLLSPPPAGVVGIGDDCAVLRDGTLLKTDALVEGRHYLPDTAPDLVGRKAVARVISDFAAMGGTPGSLLVTIGVRPSCSSNYLEEVYRGMNAISEKFAAYIVGGETVSLPEEAPQFFSISGQGVAHQKGVVLRSGAQLGDGIYVTGRLGGSFHTGRHLTFTPRVREAAWLMEYARPSAMMDLSDGLAQDLQRLRVASTVGYTLDLGCLPLHDGVEIRGGLCDGEDYELLFTVSSEQEPALREAPFPLSRIGEVTETCAPLLDGGWDHFQKEIFR